MLHQRTVKAVVCGTGVGLHTGQTATFRIVPAPPDSGITFTRALPGLPGSRAIEIAARAENVTATRLATTLGRGEVTIGTVEHLLSALYGLGVDNARVEVEGSEVPILDGSAQGFVDLILAAGGTVAQRRPKRFLVVRRAVEVQDGDRFVRLEPASRFELDCTIDFNHPILSRQELRLSLSDVAFVRELARARTFGFGRDVDAMLAAGLAKGGSVDNAVVIDDYSIRNPEGLRFPDEFVRHKMLDAIGDLALLGAPLIGRYVGHKAGHALNTELVGRLLADPRAHEIVELRQRRDAELAKLELPAFRLGSLAPA